jgi:hypothetical protein
VSLKSNQCFSLVPQQSVKSYGEDGDGSGLQTAVSVRVPLEHDLDPDKVYPLLQVGVHVAPSARVEVHPEPGAPFVMAPDASHEDDEHVPQHIPPRRIAQADPVQVEVPQPGLDPATSVCVLHIRSPQSLLKVNHSFSASPTAIQLSPSGISMPEGGILSVQKLPDEQSCKPLSTQMLFMSDQEPPTS